MAVKDKDMMRDTGGGFRHKELRKPPRSDRRKPKVDKNDPDFKDTKRDSDLKREKIARELVEIARELIGD